MKADNVIVASRFVVVTSLMVLFVVVPLFSIDSQTEKCTRIENSELRLQCFDESSKALVGDVSQAAVATASNRIDTTLANDDLAATPVGPNLAAVPVDRDIGGWRVERETDPLDDTESVTFKLTASMGESIWGAPITLMTTCQADSIEIRIDWNESLWSDGAGTVYKNVALRFGKDGAISHPWHLSPNREITIVREAASAVLRGMVGSNSLVAQVALQASDTRTAVFDTSGLEEAMKPFETVCRRIR